ncbi:MAG: hypothetical protein WCK37_00140 [Candidatus Falkowbacteria bacterium]
MFLEAAPVMIKRTDPNKNEIFKLEKNLDQIYEFSRELAGYLKTEKITNVVLLDRKARNMYVGIKEYWKACFPETPEPNYYFINTKEFQYGNESKIAEEFSDVYKKLNAAKDQSVLVLDACIHSGASMFPVKDFLNNNGFIDVRLAAIKTGDQDPNVLESMDLMVGDNLKNGAARGCTSFGDGTLVERNPGHIYSKPSENEEDRRKALQSRKEIKAAIAERIAKDNN